LAKPSLHAAVAKLSDQLTDGLYKLNSRFEELETRMTVIETEAATARAAIKIVFGALGAVAGSAATLALTRMLK